MDVRLLDRDCRVREQLTAASLLKNGNHVSTCCAVCCTYILVVNLFPISSALLFPCLRLTFSHLHASRNLSYLQLMNKEPMGKVSFDHVLDVFLRYPGLCRYNIW